MPASPRGASPPCAAGHLPPRRQRPLAAKGVSREIVAAVIEAEREADPEADSEETAAWAYAKRRRLGPYRLPDKREAYRERDLASLARQGFPFALARRIVEAEEVP